MSFGLTNAPSTFQSLMNQFFKSYLRKFILFFYDILIYSKDEETHLHHLKITFGILRQNQLFAKLSKCRFSSTEISYLGHLISAQGVKADPGKIKAMLECSTPHSVKSLRSFLGLIGYYRRFIRGYRSIATKLTSLLRKDNFKWDVEARLAFDWLKTTVT